MVWVNTYCTNKKDAEKILRQYANAEIEYKLGLRECQLPNNDIPTLSAAIKEYLKSVKKNPKISSNGTYELKKDTLRPFSLLLGKNLKVSELQKRDGSKYEDYLSSLVCGGGAFKGQSGLTDATKNIRMRQVMAFLNWCVNEQEWLDKLPFKLKQIPTDDKVKLITPSEFELILANEPNENLRSYYRLAYYCGLRRCEINHTELSKDRNGEFVLLVTKTKGRPKRKRDVLVNDNLINDWHRVKSVMYKKDRITKNFNRACKRAGLYVPYQTTMHALRHSYATIQASKGKNIHEIAKSMGHTRLSTTEKYADAERDMYVKIREQENNGIYA